MKTRIRFYSHDVIVGLLKDGPTSGKGDVVEESGVEEEAGKFLFDVEEKRLKNEGKEER